MQDGAASAGTTWQTKHVYIMAAVSLVLGVALGYLARGSASPRPAVVATGSQGQFEAPDGSGGMAGSGQMPTLEQMKHMADKQAQPLLDQLAKTPGNAGLLVQVGDVYKSTHQFQDAAAYYEKSLAIDPKNVEVRTDMASCLFYSGRTDQAIAELETSLKYDPKHAGTLFNLGMIKWKGKADAAGAIAAWQSLLQIHPDVDNRPMVEKLIAEARQHTTKSK